MFYSTLMVSAMELGLSSIGEVGEGWASGSNESWHKKHQKMEASPGLPVDSPPIPIAAWTIAQ